ncbi:aspartate aminotransferase family protein [Fodinicurvata halophila]|uniref:Aspartate aminotransferase family protein n=1 Tax=Fodinicurvata halophila TaxID=1419723 RepID=A0ABV8ULC6_9PROT
MSRSNSHIMAEYRQQTPGSARLYERANQVFPSGITHDSRHMKPYPIYVDQAEGAHKRDVDGNDYIDYFGGHGALLLGHSHPEVTEAAQAALARGTQYAASHEPEVIWGEAVLRMLPGAERVRFTASGTEATLLALRLARAFTGRDKIVRFKGHFHGWHDHMTSGYVSHFDGSPTPGVLPEVAEKTVLVDSDDSAGIEAALGRDDIAAVFLEPTGGSFGMIPVAETTLHELRRLTQANGSLLIFDEVISGFRCSPGGAQQAYGIQPDLTTLAKIVAGGLPGGAVAGRKDILDWLDFAASEAAGRQKILHPGTFNGNPVSAAAAITTLRIIETTDACERANRTAETLRRRMNEVLADKGIGWSIYGTFSGFHVFMNPEDRTIDPMTFDPLSVPWKELKTKPADAANALRLALLLEGVDIGGWPGGLTSAAHSEADVEATIQAFSRAIDRLKAEGMPNVSAA